MMQTELGEDEALIDRITDHIALTGDTQMTVEEIQDKVEFELMKSPRKEVARIYIAYRDKRSIARRAKTRDMFLEIIPSSMSERAMMVLSLVEDPSLRKTLMADSLSDAAT